MSTLESIQYEVLPHPRFETLMKLSLSVTQAAELGERFQQRLPQNRQVVCRLPLDAESQNWVIYFKLRKEGAKSLLARPDQRSWVATICFSEQTLSTAIDALKNGFSTHLEQLEVYDRTTNFALQIEVNP